MDSVNSLPPNRSKSNPRARINRLLIVTICVIVVVFLEGSIFQSTVLGKEFRGNLQGVFLFSILVFSSVSCQILFLIQVRSLIKSGMSNDGLYSRIWFFIKSVQCTIVIILLLITIQIILTASYYLPTVLFLVGASNVPAIALFVLLIIKLARWSKTNSDYTVFGFMIGIASIAINLFFMTLFLFDTPKILHSTIDASRCGLMCYSLGSVYYPAYSITYLISFFAVLASSITLFRNFHKRFETVKFWLILSIPIFLIVIRVNNDLLRDFVFLLNLEPGMRHILYAILLDMIGPSAGISAGLIFWLMTKNISQPLLKNHILLISYGTILLLSLNQSTGLALFQYPPLGVVSISFMSLASYSMFVGVYFSAIYVAQDQKMRSFISNPKYPSAKQLRFLTSIGTSENMQRVMSNINDVVSNLGTSMENESGVPSNWEENLNKYLASVLSFKKSLNSNTRDVKINFYTITEFPFGKPWETWVQLWWKWRHQGTEQINNEEQGPDIQSESPMKNQVRFLVPTFRANVNGNYFINSDTAIFFPIVANLISYHEYPTLKNESDLHTYAHSELVQRIPYRVFVNKIEIRGVHIFRINTALFDIDVATEHQEKYVTTKGVSDGYWIFLKPLPPGHYTLRFISNESNISTKNKANLQNKSSTEDFKCDIVVV